ncbi:MAG: hypothetical protein AAFV93_14360 [Chloroflexota bacterium]
MIVPEPLILEEFYTMLVTKMTPQDILDFKVSDDAQMRIHYLLDKNSAGTLTAEERIELERSVQVEQFFGVLKAKALKTQSKAR